MVQVESARSNLTERNTSGTSVIKKSRASSAQTMVQ